MDNEFNQDVKQETLNYFKTNKTFLFSILLTLIGYILMAYFNHFTILYKIFIFIYLTTVHILFIMNEITDNVLTKKRKETIRKQKILLEARNHSIMGYNETTSNQHIKIKALNETIIKQNQLIKTLKNPRGSKK